MQQFGWQPGNFNCMTVDFTAKQPGILQPYLFSGLPAEVGIIKEDKEVETSPNAPNLYSNHETTGKKFFIFDRSGAETRMILSSLRPPVTNPAAVAAKPVLAYELHEDDGIGEGSECHEDTEEINALLDSDDNDGGDDEEVSTGRSPLALMNTQCSDEEEVTSSVHPLKRPKLLAMASKPMQKVSHGQYENERVVDVNTCDIIAPCPTVGAKRSRRENIRKNLRIIEKLVPGSKSKDPSVILEEAIHYLKSLNSYIHEGNDRGPRI